MIKNAKKTDAEKQLIKFRNQLHNLLIKYPEIRLAGTSEGDAMAWIRSEDGKISEIYLPTSGKQEPIRELTANGVPVSL
jgi:hypothetical protein